MMMKKMSGIELMEHAPVSLAIVRLALPMMLGSVAQMIYNMTDTFFIGQTGDPNMVAGISLSMPLFMVSQGLGNVFAMGASSYMSRMLGAKNLVEARHTNAVSFYFVIGMGLLITVLLFFFQDPILHLIGTSDVTFQYAKDYFSIISYFILFSMVNIALNGQIRAEGASSIAMKGMFIGIFLNIVLDPIFILWLDMGVSGAAWATIIGMIASVIYFLAYFQKGTSILSISPRDFKPNRKMFSEIFKIGIPAAISNIIFSLVGVITNIIAASYGDHVIAGSGISMRVTMLSFTLIMSLAFGYQPFAGFNFGARNIKRLISGWKITMLYTTCLAVFFTIIFWFFGRFIMVLFIRDELTIETGSKMMQAFLLGMPFIGLQVTMMVTFQALGKAVQATIVNMGRQFLVYLPLLFTLNSFFGFNGFIYAQPISDIITTVVSCLMGISLIKSVRSLHVEGGIPASSVA
jgi:putative MATE family efflux protein